MRLVNKTSKTLFFSDVNLTILHDAHGEGVEVDDFDVDTSPTLKTYIEQGKVAVLDGDESSQPYKAAVNIQKKAEKKQPRSIKKIGSAEVEMGDSDGEGGEDSFFADDKPTVVTGGNKRDSFSGKSSIGKFKQTGIMDVNYHGMCYTAAGYSKMNRGHILGLSKYDDVNMKITGDKIGRAQLEGDLVDELRSFENNKCGEDAIRIHGSTMETYRWTGYKIQYTMAETDRLHKTFVERINASNEVWTPSKWCAEKFKESNVVRPIHHVPIGFNSEVYNEDKKPLDFGGKLRGFVFTSVFSWSWRKGFDVLLKAYFDEFSGDDDVTLLLCSRLGGSSDQSKKDRIKKVIRDYKESSKNPNPPHIIYFGDVMPELMMGNLYNSANAFVMVSRGEGFAMPYIEASMCGLPIIASNYSGHTDFLNHDNSYLVEPEKIIVQKKIEEISAFYQGCPAADFGADATYETRQHMRSVYENYGNAIDKNKRLQQFIRENYDWKICAEKAHKRLLEIYGNLR
jgi:glycosyltransferase involved in cell wall biosynthesis